MQVAVLVPVKAFTDAKHRLAAAIAPDERAVLARSLATRVVRAAKGLPVYVVCDDDEVAAWAATEGASVLWRPAAGLNDAVTFGVGAIADAGFTHVVVAHGDLPLAEDLTVAAGFDGVTLVPDRHEDGTNVLTVPVAAGFVFHYGPGSYARHLTEADRVGQPVRIVRDPSLAWDVDVPADLQTPDPSTPTGG